MVTIKLVERKKTKVTPKKKKTTPMEEPPKVYSTTRACTHATTAKKSAPKVKTNVKRAKPSG